MKFLSDSSDHPNDEKVKKTELSEQISDSETEIPLNPYSAPVMTSMKSLVASDSRESEIAIDAEGNVEVERLVAQYARANRSRRFFFISVTFMLFSVILPCFIREIEIYYPCAFGEMIKVAIDKMFLCFLGGGLLCLSAVFTCVMELTKLAKLIGLPSSQNDQAFKETERLLLDCGYDIKQSTIGDKEGRSR